MVSVTLEQAIAATRFGFGARPTDFAAIGADPKGWLKAQTNPGNDSVLNTPLPSASEYYELIWGGVPSPTMSSAGLTPMTLFDYELRVRSRFTQQTGMPFRERFVHFWSNHFSVSGKSDSAPISVGFEREVVRPNVMGRFADMLLASSQHPIMISYLDNTWSVGPNSQLGAVPGHGINENLAREILELHTLGVNGGYTQTDVTLFAKVITGWSFSTQANGSRPYGKFYFEPTYHEPGARTVVGKDYSQAGIDQGLAVIQDIARHPSTIDHVCTKIAKAFHSDNPPTSLIDQLKAAWTLSDGNLSTISQALVDAPEMWTAAQQKVKSADDYWMSMLRAMDPNWPDAWVNLWAYLCLGAPPFTAPSPAGWPVANTNWAAAGSLRNRLNLAIDRTLVLEQQISGDVVEFGRSVLGPLLRPATEAAIQAAGSRHSGLAILFMSPEFQRR